MDPWATATTLPAIAKAGRKAIETLKKYAGLSGGTFSKAKTEVSYIRTRRLLDKKGKTVHFMEVLKAHRLASAEGEGLPMDARG